MLRLLIGGSPCTHWSIAQSTQNRETKPEGIGWELFKNFLIAKEKFKPDYFLYENNKSAAPPIKDQISRELGVPLQCINSALVSAQNRQRFYAHNIPNVPQPEDRGILLRDILESGTAWKEKAYTLDANYWKTSGVGLGTQAGRRKMVAEPVLNINPSGKGMNGTVITTNGKSRCFTTNKGEGQKIIEPVRIGTIENNAQNKSFDSKQYRVYSPDGKSTTLCGQGGGLGAKTGLYACPWDGKTYPFYQVQNGLITVKGKTHPIKLADGFYIIRKLTVTECKRLQTVPDSYIMPCSATQNYKMFGNGWTVAVISHILSHIPNIKNEPIEVLSMYDGMSCGHIALDELGAHVTRYYASEIDKYAIQTTMANYPDTVQFGDAFRVRESGWKQG